MSNSARIAVLDVSCLEFVDCFPESLALWFEFGIFLDQILCRDLQSVLKLFGKILLKIRALFLRPLRNSCKSS